MGRRVIVKASNLKLTEAQFSLRLEETGYFAYVEYFEQPVTEHPVFKMDAYYVEGVLHFEMDFNVYIDDVFMQKYKFINNCFDTFTVV